jgi:hypothetical protein
MEPMTAITAWRDVFWQALSDLAARMAAFLPNLVGALLILAFGYALARLVELIASRGLRGLGLDRAATRLGIGEVLDRGGVHRPLSEVVAQLLFWLLMLTFVLSAVETLGLRAVAATLDRLVAYIPSLIGAGFIVFIGLLVARFSHGVVASASAAAGLENAQRLGSLVQALVIALVVVLAANQLGVQTSVLVGPLTALVGAAALAAGLAFALGARPIVTHILAGHFLKQSLPRDTFVEIDGRRGVVERVGSTDTLLRDGEQRWSVPNAQLLEKIVAR